MLYGTTVKLRARIESDVAILHEGLHNDVATRLRASGDAWLPISPTLSSFAIAEDPARVASFTVVQRDTDAVLGAALLWGIDTHNRLAHIGISLLAEHCGHGFGTDTLGVLCRYGFQILGLHRIQLETLSDNAAMIGSARAAGFTVEGTLRESSWLQGGFHDDVVLGQLVNEWTDPTTTA